MVGDGPYRDHRLPPQAPAQEAQAQPAIATPIVITGKRAHAAQITQPIVTTRSKPGRFGNAPDLTTEEQQRRGDAADELFRELVRRATGKS